MDMKTTKQKYLNTDKHLKKTELTKEKMLLFLCIIFRFSFFLDCFFFVLFFLILNSIKELYLFRLT